MAKANRRLLVALAVVVAISAVLLGFDPALIGAVALGVSAVVLVVQFVAKSLLGPSSDSRPEDPFDVLVNDARRDQELNIEDEGTYNPRNPAVPLHLDPSAPISGHFEHWPYHQDPGHSAH